MMWRSLFLLVFCHFPHCGTLVFGILRNQIFFLYLHAMAHARPPRRGAGFLDKITEFTHLCMEGGKNTMNKKSLLHMLDFDEVYCYLATGQKTKEEIVQFFEDRGVAPSTIRRYMKVLQNVDKGMLSYSNGVFCLNEDLIKTVIAEVLDELHIPINLGESSYISMAEKENRELAELIRQLENKIHENEEEKESLQRFIQEQEKILTEKDVEIQQLVEECKRLKMEQIEKHLNRDVVYVKALSLNPRPNAKEQLFLDDVIVHLDLDKSISKYGGRRPSFYRVDTVGEEQILNEKNYFTYLGKKLFSVPFLKDWLEQMESEKELRNLTGMQKESASAKQVRQEAYDKKSPLDKCIEEHLRQRMIAVETLLNDDRLSDQMKLQLYARYGQYHGTELEQLLLFAAEHGINAKWFIQIVEGMEEGDYYENVRDALSIYADPSEYRKKLDFARELADGVWTIEMEYDGKPTRFALVPVDELKEIQHTLMLPIHQFRYREMPKVKEPTCGQSDHKLEKGNETEPVRKADFVPIYHEKEGEEYEFEQDFFVSSPEEMDVE